MKKPAYYKRKNSWGIYGPDQNMSSSEQRDYLDDMESEVRKDRYRGEARQAAGEMLKKHLDHFTEGARRDRAKRLAKRLKKGRA